MSRGGRRARGRVDRSRDETDPQTGRSARARGVGPPIVRSPEGTTQTLSDLGVSKKLSSRWQARTMTVTKVVEAEKTTIEPKKTNGLDQSGKNYHPAEKTTGQRPVSEQFQGLRNQPANLPVALSQVRGREGIRKTRTGSVFYKRRARARVGRSR